MYIGECWSIIMTRSRYRRQADILSTFQGVSWSSTRRALTGLCGQTVDAFGNLLYQNKEWWLCTIFLLCLVCKRAHNTPMDLTKIDSGSEVQGYPAWIGILGQTTATCSLSTCNFMFVPKVIFTDRNTIAQPGYLMFLPCKLPDCCQTYIQSNS